MYQASRGVQLWCQVEADGWVHSAGCDGWMKSTTERADRLDEVRVVINVSMSRTVALPNDIRIPTFTHSEPTNIQHRTTEAFPLPALNASPDDTERGALTSTQGTEDCAGRHVPLAPPTTCPPSVYLVLVPRVLLPTPRNHAA